MVTSGRVKLFKSSPEGRELAIKIMGPNDYFCCAPLYLDGRYSVSAVAMEDSSLVLIPVEDFKEMLNANVSEIGFRLISGLCSKIKYLSNLVGTLTFKDVEQRVILTLLRFAEEKSSEDNLVFLSLTHQDIASMTGTVREVVSRTMSRLKKDGIITDSSFRGFVIDKERLSGLLNDEAAS